jgi:hypothetical protein
VVVELDGAGEPRRVGHGTDEDEQRPRVDRTGARTSPSPWS